jgi:hypothetical protein
MDIQKILDSLGLDLTNPEIKRGAIEAIDAILGSRSSDTGGSGGNPIGDTDIEIDPDLIMPSQKEQSQDVSDDDIEIEDEEGLLDQVEFNQSEDDSEGEISQKEKGDSEETGSDSSSDQSSTESDGEESSEEDDSEEDSSGSGSGLTDSDDEEDMSETTEDDAASDETTQDGSSENDQDTSGTDDDEDVDSNEVSDDSSEESELDDDDLLDDKLKNTYKDETVKNKQDARKIKRERTLQAAKTALDSAKAKNAPKALIQELENAIYALEALTEAASKSINDISDDEFNNLVNRVFDAIEALGDSGLTYSTDEERELQAQEIKTDLSSNQTQQELSAEDIAQIRAETQAVKAREKETNKYKPRARSSFKGFQDFLNSLYRAVALQVSIEEVQDDTWSAINRRHSGAGVLQPGKRLNELPSKKIPVIDFYFDCSGSWTDSDLAVGKKAIDRLIEMEENGQIKINIFYFSTDVFTDATSARAHGGTSAWNEIVKNIIVTKATNVVIMTDSDMENWWNGDKALSYTVPGYVWYLWRDGENAPRLPRDLKGRGGTQQFSFSTSDA